MTKMKVGGMVLTGVGAFLILNKLISSMRGAVHDLSDAMKWRAYYKCERPDPLAPGYERTYSTTKNTEALGDRKNGPKKDAASTAGEAVGNAVAGVITKAVDNLFKAPEEASTPLESPYKAISKDDLLNDAGYDKNRLFYYFEIDVLTDENGVIIMSNPKGMIGSYPDELEFDEEGCCYIRNDIYHVDYKIVRKEGDPFSASASETYPGMNEDEKEDVES